MKRQLLTVMPVLALMAAAAWALSAFVDVSLVDQPGVRMELPAELAGWTAHELRFCHNPECKREFRLDELGGRDAPCPVCGSRLHTMTLEEYEQLPKDTEFRKAIYQNSAGEAVQVSIVLTGRERESIHRPERCLVGQGFHIMGGGAERFQLADGRPLDVMVFLTRREAVGGAGEQTGYYAYWFVGQGRETPWHLLRMFWLAWDRVVHGVAHRWAYISVAGWRNPEREDYRRQLAALIPELHRALVLPAPSSTATRNPTSGPE
ncbi:MAG: EpsI family protein [Kiritimatiellae bacterium]|nr:EpsI family protein [Kiritimatiellia bacterium]